MTGAETPSQPPLDAEKVAAHVAAALAAIAAADSSAVLKQVRQNHVGERAPLAVANRAIGTLPLAGSSGRPGSRSSGRSPPGRPSWLPPNWRPC